MHRSFVTTAAPHPPTEKGGDSQAKVWGNYFCSVPAVQGKWLGFDIRKNPYPRVIFYCEGKDKEQSFDLQFAPWGRGL